MPERISVQKGVLAAMLAQARGAGRAECCGLLAGRDGAILRILPARNAAKRPESEYEIAPGELFALIREIRAAGLEMLGIYHSHPAGDNTPSVSDIARAFYPEAAYFIVSPGGGDEKTEEGEKTPTLALRARMGHPQTQQQTKPAIRAFAIHDGGVQ